MSLSIYYSDKIEELAEHLKGKLLAERQAPDFDPFDFSQVVVPNKNIAKWLQIGIFSNTRELCAGIEFPFMEKRLTDLLARNLPKDRKFSLLPDHAYANAILATLLTGDHPEFDAFAPFRSYIADGDADAAQPLEISTQKSARMAWQLADRLADLMDQYEVRRPDIVENWLAFKNADGKGAPTPGSAETGEAALARALWGPKGFFPASGERLSLRQLYDCVKDTEPSGPKENIWFFGQSTLSLLQARILVWLAKRHDVVFYHNNVCLEYWGDIETKEERKKRLGHAHDAEEDIAIENPLLNQWGAAGRETMRLLVDLEEDNTTIDFKWECVAPSKRPERQKVLGIIQDSIRHRTSDMAKAPQDASLQVIGTPGVRREVEMVYNAILGAVWKPEGSGERPWTDCSFSDIAVLVPDMATYRPVIESVFDARDKVPYGLVDTTASEDSAYLSGFLALADLARKGLTRETLFAVLDNPCVQEAHKFSPDDVREWRGLTARIGAFDGFESRGEESFFNWDWALSRLRLATVADEVARGEGTEDGDAIPLVPVNETPTLRLSGIVELLYQRVKEVFGDVKSASPMRHPCAPRQSEDKDSDKPYWSRVLSRLARDFLAVPKDDELEAPVRRQVLLTLGGLHDIPGEQGFELAVAAVEHFVGGISCRKGGYLTDGVTIAGLLPMRPVPFKQIFVLGLGEGGFPGRTGAADTLDVRGTGWKLGDVSVPKTNRYLFLETLMAVRDRLVLSYPNRDIEKDAELFPSGIIRELEDFAGEIVDEGKFKEFKGYPLLERGEYGAPLDKTPVCDITWSENDRFAGLLPTYSAFARNMAASQRGAAKANVFAAPTEGGDASRQVRPEVSAKELSEFLKSPLHAVLRFRVGIAEKGVRNQELDIDSPLGIPDGPVKWGLQSEWLQGNGEVDAPLRGLQLAGQTPVGFLGDFSKEKFEEKVSEAGTSLLAFAKEFGLGEEGCATMRQSFPETLDDGHSRQEVLFTSATPNWRETGNEVSVLVARSLGANPPQLPSENALEPFVSFLMFVKKKEVPWSLRVGVIDIEHGKTASWRWKGIEPQVANAYLQRLTLLYLGYLVSPAEGRYVDFPYRQLAKGLEGKGAPIDWGEVLETMTAEEFTPKHGKGKKGVQPAKNYDRSLVVEQSVEDYRRDPTADELEKLHAAIYQLPLSGMKEEADATQANATQEGAQ